MHSSAHWCHVHQTRGFSCYSGLIGMQKKCSSKLYGLGYSTSTSRFHGHMPLLRYATSSNATCRPLCCLADISQCPDMCGVRLQEVEKKRQFLLAGRGMPHMGPLGALFCAHWPVHLLQLFADSPRCAACEEQMLLLKRDFLPSLAREHGVQEQYIHGCKV